MDLEKFLENMNNGKTVECPSDYQETCDTLLLEATKIKMKLNCEYHTEEEIREIFSELTSQEINETLRLVPPFHTDCGKISILVKMYLLTQIALCKIKAEYT